MSKKTVGLIALLLVFSSILAACGATPTPVPAEPTSTVAPTIIILTPTPQPVSAATEQATEAAPAEPTATTAPTEKATAEPTKRATEAPEATAEPEETAAEPTETSAAQPPPPTRTPEMAETIYPPPVLLEPPNNRPVRWRESVPLIWSSVGELAEDEYYHLHLERRPQTEGQEWYGDYVYTKETEFLVEPSFLAPFHPPNAQGHGFVYWWVRVVRKTGEDENGKPIGIDLSPSSEERVFIVEPKPE
jgi:hypothetical protein